MFTFPRAKPRRPAPYKPSETSYIHLHTGENSTAYNNAVYYQNFLSEMFKFFPNFVVNGYETGKETNYNEYGSYENGFIDTAPDEEGEWYTRGYAARGLLEGGYAERYGDIHNVSIGGQFWGYGLGKKATNIDYDSSASEWDHFEGALDAQDSETPLDINSYNHLVYNSGSSLVGIDSSLWSRAASFLSSQAGDRNYYDIVMSGIANTTIEGWRTDQDVNFNGTIEANETNLLTVGDPNESSDGKTYHVVHNGGYVYDNWGPQGALYLLISLLESRRRVSYASSSLWGSPYMINDSEDNRDYINNVFSNKNMLGGLDAENAQVFELFFGAQHALRNILTAYSGGVNSGGDTLKLKGEVNGSINEFNAKDDGFVGLIYTAKDQVAFQRFRHWICNQINSLKNYSAADLLNIFGVSTEGMSNDEINSAANACKSKIDGYYKEFIYDEDYATSYGASEENTNAKYLSWDRFHTWWTDDNNPPYGVNPYFKDRDVVGSHKNYAISQLFTKIIEEDGKARTVLLSDKELKGGSLVEGKNLNEENWSVYAYSLFLTWGDKMEERMCSGFSNFQLDYRRYRHDIREYKKWKEDTKEKQQEEKIEEAREAQRRAARKKAEQSSANKGKTRVQNDRKATDAEMQKFKETMAQSIYKKMAEASKQRQKSSRESSSQQSSNKRK